MAWEVSLVRGVCVSRLCEWKEGRKRTRKHSNPRKTVEKQRLISNITALLFYLFQLKDFYLRIYTTSRSFSIDLDFILQIYPRIRFFEKNERIGNRNSAIRLRFFFSFFLFFLAKTNYVWGWNVVNFQERYN